MTKAKEQFEREFLPNQKKLMEKMGYHKNKKSKKSKFTFSKSATTEDIKEER